MSPGTTGNLSEQLEGTLAGAEVREIHGDVGVNYTDQCHERKIETLGDHLRAEQDIDFATLDAAENIVMRPFRRRRVYIHPRDARLRKCLHDLALDLLRAYTSERKLRRHAARAHRGRGLFM